MPSAVFHDTTTSLATVPDSTASKLAGEPSATLRVVGSRDSVTEPASVRVVSALVPAPRLAAPPPPVTPVRVTESVSLGSRTVSVRVATVTSPEPTPAGIVNVPEGAV